MLPPIGAGARIERRRRARRSADAPAAAPDVAVEAPAAVEPKPELDAQARPPRRGGRRASDKTREAEAGAAKLARAPRPFAPLVAQVIAGVLGLEQTRARRRATFAEAEALYRPKRERAKRSRGEA